MSCCGKKPRPRKVSGAFKIRKFGGKKKLTVQSTGPALKTLLLCRPDFYGISYVINPWMDLTKQADRQRAIEQWDFLKDRLREFGADTQFVPSKPDLPDMVFTANAGLVVKGQKVVVLSNFKHDERKPEEQWFLEYFLEAGYVVKYPSKSFEGAGDALYLGDTLVGGWGFRSDQEVYEEIRPFLNCPVVTARLVDARFYHLDTCFCPLDGMDYLIFPGAFDESGLATIRSLGGNEIAVPEGEAVRFACNAVCLGRTVILPTGCPQTVQMLEQGGYKAVPVEMDQFIKAGGACKCLTLAL